MSYCNMWGLQRFHGSGSTVPTQLLQAVVYRTHTIDNCEQSLPLGEEFAGSIWNEELPLPRPEIPWPSPPVSCTRCLSWALDRCSHTVGRTALILSCMSLMYSMTYLKRAGCSSYASLVTSRSLQGRRPNRSSNGVKPVKACCNSPTTNST